MATVNDYQALRVRVARRRKIVAWFLVLTLLNALALPVISYVDAYFGEAQAQSEEEANPRANFWRAVREGNTGYSAVTGPESNVLIQSAGESWRQMRNGPLVTYGGLLMAGMLAAILLFYLFRGRIRIEAGHSNMRVPRFTLTDRILHWFVVTLFMLLAITGLILLYGQAALIPVFGLEGFAAIAAASKDAHNLFGPIFVVALLVLILKFIRGNLPAKGDLGWFAKGGGLLGKHVSTGRYNAGEKLWFWVVTIAGLIVSVTGLVLDFPIFDQTRNLMQWSQLLHAGAALIFITGAFGHIYIGTLGMEGALDAMTKGHVDANWAKEHHDQWFEQMRQQGRLVEPEPGKAAGPAAQAPPPGAAVVEGPRSPQD